MPSLRCLGPLVLSAILFVAAGNATAASPSQQDADAKSQLVIEIGNKTVELLIERFRPVFPGKDVELLSKDRIRVVAQSGSSAFADHEQRRILVPARFVAELQAQTQATLMLRQDPSLQPQYARWLVSLGKRSTEVRQRALRGETLSEDVAIAPFWTFAGLPAPGKLSPDDAREQERMLTESLALVVAHELGHLVKRHRPYTEVTAERSREQEHEADAFAAELVEGSGMSVIAGLTPFVLRFAVNEPLEKGIPPNLGTHPPAECRMYRLGSPAVEKLAKSPDPRAEFARSGLTSLSEFQQTLKALEARCAP